MKTFAIYRYPTERRFVVIIIENIKVKFSSISNLRNKRTKLHNGRHAYITSFCIAT